MSKTVKPPITGTVKRAPGFPIKCNFIAIGMDGKATAFEKKPSQFYGDDSDKKRWWWARDSHMTHSGYFRHDWATGIYWLDGKPGELFEVID